MYHPLFSFRQCFNNLCLCFVLDSELEELETPIRYRPDSLSALCRTTRFSEAEIKRIYRGFKAECPTGVVREDTFKLIYAQFFPQGGEHLALRVLFAHNILYLLYFIAFHLRCLYTFIKCLLTFAR